MIILIICSMQSKSIGSQNASSSFLNYSFLKVNKLMTQNTKKDISLKKSFAYISSIILSTGKASSKSFLFPKTKTGMFASCGFSKRLRNSVLAASNFSWSAESITNLLNPKKHIYILLSRKFFILKI